jgi:hypothetical protein
MANKQTVQDVNPEARLAELNLDVDLLIEVVMAGEAARATCNANDPRNLPGLLAWARIVRALRERTAPRGYKRSDDGGLPCAVNAAGTVAIAVATGNGATGSDEMPRTRNPKGPATHAAIAKNQLALFDLSSVDLSAALPPEVAATPDRITLFLLVSRTPGEIRSELSLPAKTDETGRVVGWTDRIPLPAIKLDAPEELLEPTEEIDLDLRRKPD